MSIKRLPRELGLIVRCNGAGTEPCAWAEKFQTGNIMAKKTRAWLAKEKGWGRGLLKGRKRLDLCPACMPLERKALEKHQAERAKEIERRDELKKAKFSATPRPKKPRKPKNSAAPASSPSEACAPAPSM